MLRLSNLNIGYNDSAPVVSSIDAELSDGCFCCLLGRNGTGKSTLLRTIAGLQHPLTGTIERPDSIGIVLTAIPNLLNTKVREMVAYGRLAHTGIWGRLHDEDYAMADEAIRLVPPRVFSLEQCLEGAALRIGIKREDLPWIEEEFDPEFRQYILDFHRDQLPRIYELVEQYQDIKRITIFHSREEADEWITRLRLTGTYRKD